MTDIERAARVVAEKLLGWEWGPQLYGIPGKKVWITKTVEYHPRDYLRTGNGMVEVMEALRAAHYQISIEVTYPSGWSVYISPQRTAPAQQAEALPDALLLAAEKLYD